jgi:hypothetical protein
MYYGDNVGGGFEGLKNLADGQVTRSSIVTKNAYTSVNYASLNIAQSVLPYGRSNCLPYPPISNWRFSQKCP